MTAPRLVPAPSGRREPAADAGQAAVLALLAQGAGNLLVTGGAGTGKTTLAVLAATQAVAGGTPAERVLVLASTRAAAAAMRDRVSLAIGVPTSVPVARTAAAAAFAILRAQADLREDPRPSLVSGAEQDVVLRELLEGHLVGRAAPLEWGDSLPQEATVLGAFREELRNLLMRAAEADLDPASLRSLGVAAGKPEWVAAADLYAEYEGVMALRTSPGDQGARYDPATIVARAADALATWEADVGGEAPCWDLVIVDDYQDATAATTALLHQVAANGARVVLIGNADESVQGYRGAVPGGLAAALNPDGFAAEHRELTSDHRQSGVLARVTAAVATRIGVKGVGSARATARALSADAAAGGGAVLALTAPHAYGQSRAIAAELRRARHGLDGPPVAWSSMAVIARSAAALRALRSDLLAADIPCESVGEGAALHKEPAVAPLLTLLGVALGGAWTEESAVEVLTSRLVGLDPVGVRRLRRELVREERAAGGARASAELIVDAMSDPARLATLPGPEAIAAARAARASAAATRRAAQPAATPGAVIWAAWEALAVVDAWRAGALAGSARDDADLDAVIALLRAAQTFTERLPEARTEAFLDYLEGQDFAADTLGARATARDAVCFATPAAALGREWDVVVLAGVHEGAWPNLRPRDSVLGAQRLADALAEGHRGAAERASETADARSARSAVLDDETRALLVAVSRARHTLVVTAVDDGETRPSRFMALIEDAAGIERREAGGRRGVADLRAAVAELRAEGLRAATAVGLRPGDEAAEASLDASARMLAYLAGLSIQGAAPEQWHGVPELSTAEPFWDEDAQVRVSPSKLDVVRTCGLKWALETAGATAESSSAQNVGLLVHEIAAALPHGTATELLDALDRRWSEIGGTDTWVDRVQYERARDMMRRLAGYLSKVTAADVRVEQGFGVDLGRARVAGLADRVEVTGDTARIVDLKTGRTVSAAEAEDHGQLMLYQLAANHGGFESVSRATDAALVFVGGSTQSAAVRTQSPIDDAAALRVLDDAVQTMTADHFWATPNPLCDHCPVRRACPAHASGRQVSDA